MDRTGEFYLIIIIKKIAENGLIFFPSQTGAGLEDYSFLSLTTTNITHGLQTAGLCHWLATCLSQFIGCCFMKAEMIKSCLAGLLAVEAADLSSTPTTPPVSV